MTSTLSIREHMKLIASQVKNGTQSEQLIADRHSGYKGLMETDSAREIESDNVRKLSACLYMPT